MPWCIDLSVRRFELFRTPVSVLLTRRTSPTSPPPSQTPFPLHLHPTTPPAERKYRHKAPGIPHSIHIQSVSSQTIFQRQANRQMSVGGGEQGRRARRNAGGTFRGRGQGGLVRAGSASLCCNKLFYIGRVERAALLASGACAEIRWLKEFEGAVEGDELQASVMFVKSTGSMTYRAGIRYHQYYDHSATRCQRSSE